MPTYVAMQKLSDTMTEGTLVKWLKNDGDQIEVGDVLAEVETDKATMELEAVDSGTLHIIAAEGAKVGVGEKLAALLGDGEAAPSGNGEKSTEAAPKKEEPKKVEKPAAEKPAATETAKPAEKAPAPSEDSGRVKASPLARKVAAEKGVNLGGLSGSGPGGRIVVKDVESAPAVGKSAKSAPSAPAPAIARVDAPAPNTERSIPLNGMRRTIADRLLQSKTTVPHFYLFVDIDAAPLLKLREQLKQAGEVVGLGKVTVNDFVLRATAIAASRVPRINAAFTGDAIVEYGSVNLAVAVALEDGLITPVIRNAQDKRLSEISTEMKELATRARAKKLKPDEYQGGTISISNLGAYGIQSFAAIINPPQAAILSVGAIVKQPVVNDRDEIVVGHVMNLGISSDHRVADGAVAAQFLAELRKLLENPSVLLA